MIGLGSSVRVYLAAGKTDMRCGIGGLCALTRNGLALEPSDTRVVVVFRGRKGRPAENSALGRSRLLPLLQGSRARTLPLAECIVGNREPDGGADVDAVGRYRLAPAAMDLSPAPGVKISASIDGRLIPSRIGACYDSACPVAAAPLPDDPAALKALVLRLQGELRARDLLIESLRIRILRLRRQKHGASSEKIEREIEQLELVLEGVQIADG